MAIARQLDTKKRERLVLSRSAGAVQTVSGAPFRGDKGLAWRVWIYLFAKTAHVRAQHLGVTGGLGIRLGSQLDAPLDEIAASWRGGLEAALGENAVG